MTLPIIAGVDWIDLTVAPMSLGDPSAVDLPSLRVAFYTDNDFFRATPETVDAVRNTARILAGAGISVTEDRPDCLAEIMTIATQIQSVEKNAQQQGIWAEFTGPAEMHLVTIRRHAEMWLQRSGVQIVTGPWREDVALAVAKYIEIALGGGSRHHCKYEKALPRQRHPVS